MQETRCLIRDLLSKEDGIAAIEYGLLAALIAAGVIGAVTTVGLDVAGLLDVVNTAFKNITLP